MQDLENRGVTAGTSRLAVPFWNWARNWTGSKSAASAQGSLGVGIWSAAEKPRNRLWVRLSKIDYSLIDNMLQLILSKVNNSVKPRNRRDRLRREGRREGSGTHACPRPDFVPPRKKGSGRRVESLPPVLFEKDAKG